MASLVDLYNPDSHVLVQMYNVAGIADKFIRYLRDVNESVLMYSDVDKSTEIRGQLQKSVDALGGGLTKYIAQAVYEERKIRHSSHL